jgi:Transposase
MNPMKRRVSGSPETLLWVISEGGPRLLYVGLDLSRKRLDWHTLAADGERVGEGACPPDRDGFVRLVYDFDHEHRQPVLAAIESITGARFVHDQLALAGWDVRIADAQHAKGIAPLACKTDRIDAWVLAELARRDLVPEIWLPGPEVRGERERARLRLHLVHKRTSLKIRFCMATSRYQRGSRNSWRRGCQKRGSKSAYLLIESSDGLEPSTPSLHPYIVFPDGR